MSPHALARVLLIVGGLNWGLTAFGKNLVEMLLGAWPTAEMIVYLLVGIAALYEIFTWHHHGRHHG